MNPDINEQLRQKFHAIVMENNISDEPILIKTRVLSDEESIGTPRDRDYPLLKGKERLMEASFKGSAGVAFTDLYGNYEDSLYNIINMKLSNNFKRAVFISVINAVLRHLDLIGGTSHCKDNELIICRDQLADYIRKKYNSPRILMAGFQPRFAEIISNEFSGSILDLDRDNIGKDINGIIIEDSEYFNSDMNDYDVLFVTGSTFVNDTAKDFIVPGKETIYYGVTCAGPCYLLGLPRYCPEGK